MPRLPVLCWEKLKKSLIKDCSIAGVGIAIALSPSSGKALDARESLRDYRDAIERAEANSNAFSINLSELYMGLGQALISDENYPDAQRALKRGMQIERVNFGLNSISQTPYLFLLADLDTIAGDLESAQKAMDSVYQLGKNNYGALDPRMLGTLDKILNWYIIHYKANPGRSGLNYIAGADLVSQRISRLIEQSIPKEDPKAPIYYQKLAAVQYLVATYVDQNGLPTETTFEITTNSSAQTTSRSAAGLTYYRRGKAALISRVESLSNQPVADLLGKVDAIAQLADWYLIFGQSHAAIKAYSLAFQTLLDESVTEDVQSLFFSKPKKIEFILPESSRRKSHEVLEVSALITKRGRVRDIEFIDPPEDLSEEEMRSIRRSIKKSRYRPRLNGGNPEEATHKIFLARSDIEN
ncbi:MAG: hypothetical protein CBC09_06325 [Cellvibrionales bacterium TMED49]|nr:hypothetical protein [Porticoccaceae bacterium]OUU37876.1 MAG: hypothetical protein CBC09_06325 [Cellvibrionales bacterium TMED49]